MRTVREIERLTFYLPHWLSRELRLGAEKAGQPLSTYITRMLQAAIGRDGPRRQTRGAE